MPVEPCDPIPVCYGNVYARLLLDRGYVQLDMPAMVATRTVTASAVTPILRRLGFKLPISDRYVKLHRMVAAATTQ